MEHPSPFVGDGRRARPTHGKGDATTPVNGYAGTSAIWSLIVTLPDGLM
jgi:hypothetical protein